MEAYCVRCKAKKEIKDGKERVIKTRRGDKRAFAGVCPDCGTKIMRFLPKVDKK